MKKKTNHRKLTLSKETMLQLAKGSADPEKPEPEIRQWSDYGNPACSWSC